MMVEINTGQVAGCLLKKCRPVKGLPSKDNETYCSDDCRRCGWNEEEAAARIQKIREGKLSQYGQLQFLSVRK